MPYNLKHRETGELLIHALEKHTVEFDSIKEAAQYLHLANPEGIFEWKTVEVVKPLPIRIGLYVCAEDALNDHSPVNLYSRNTAGQWFILGPDGWTRRQPDTLPDDLMRLVPENS